MADSGPYHHGDLRATLLTHAAAVLEDVGYEDLGLRQLAALAGVSRSAPYRHFDTRKALLVTLGILGFQEIERAYALIASGPGSPRDRLIAVSLFYARFAANRPQLFRLMFVSEIHRKNGEPPEWTEAGMGSFRVLEALMSEHQPGAKPDAVRTAVLALWTAKHGFALLSMTNRFHHTLPDGLCDEDVLLTALNKHLPT